MTNNVLKTVDKIKMTKWLNLQIESYLIYSFYSRFVGAVKVVCLFQECCSFDYWYISSDLAMAMADDPVSGHRRLEVEQAYDQFPP